MSTSAYSPEYLSEYRGDSLLGVAALFIVLETVFVALRYYARHQTTSDLGWDDIVIPLAWLTSIGICIVGIGWELLLCRGDAKLLN